MALILIAIFHFVFLPSENIQRQSSFNFLLSITDPPMTIEGISWIHLSYENILIHKIEGDKWIALNHSGNIELMGLINTAQFLLVSKLEQGDYDLIQFMNISAIITYYGNNYTAITPSNDLLIKLDPVINISENNLTTLLIDLVPRVTLNEADNPSFILIPFAKAYASNNISDFFDINKDRILEYVKFGIKIQLKNKIIQENIWKLKGELLVSNISMKNDMISFVLTNVGNTSIELKLLIVYSTSLKINKQGIFVAVFKFLPDGSLMRISRVNLAQLKQIYHEESGYALQVGTSKVFVYQNLLSFTFYQKDQNKKLIKEGLMSIGDQTLFTIVIIGEPLVFASSSFSLR